MKTKRYISLFLCLLLVLSFTSVFALPDVNTIRTKNLVVVKDLIALGDWTDTETTICTPSNGGFVISKVKPEGTITVPLNLTVNINDMPQLGLKISGLADDTPWNWALNYVDKNGIEGSVNGTSDFGVWNDEGKLEARKGNFDGNYSVIGHFNYRLTTDEGKDLDLTSITFKDLRFYVLLEAGETCRLDAMFLGREKEPGEVAPAPADVTAAGLNFLALGAFENNENKDGNGLVHTITATDKGSGKLFTYATGKDVWWPSIYTATETPTVIKKADFSKYTLNYDFTVSNGAAISLWQNSPIDGGEQNEHYFSLCDFINGLPEGNAANDFIAGTYSDSVNFKTFLDELGFEGDEFAVGGMKIFVVGSVGATVEVRAMYLEGEGVVEPPVKEDPVSGWAAEAVERAWELGILDEEIDDNTTFKVAIPRLYFCKMAVNFIEVVTGMDIDAFIDQYEGDLVENVTFNDCDDADVLAAAALGIVNGTGNGNFSPDNSIDRRSSARMLALTCQVLGQDVDNAPIADFPDYDDISSWAQAYANYVYEQGVMTGATGGIFDPLNDYTTETSVLTFIRMFDNIDFGF